MKKDKVLLLIVCQFFILAGIFLIDTSVNGPAKEQAIGVLFTLLILITVMLIGMRIRTFLQLKQINKAIKRAVQGNLKTRLWTNPDHTLDDIIFSINELIEEAEEIQIQSLQSQQAREKILSGISHDLRTPLTSIIGYIDALKDGIAASETEKQAYLDIISRKSSRLKHLVDELFHMAKIDADEIHLEEEQLDFAEITRESLIAFLPDLKQEAIALHTTIPEKTCFIQADRLSLTRVIGNLLKNALYYGKEGKVLGVELTESANEYQLLIWDQGPGISDQDMPYVFDKMYRVDQSRNQWNKGSGLGLAIAKALVEKQHGKIWVESNPWTRTTFGFSLPKYDEKNLFKKQLRNH
ncbi:sensor histidine kinase [Gracilibacillus timonensis]|uniref:sensor histidine kinase n=1 Tax=Gracilibacillus timonensis TaxID=1816696 RepID=UPI0008265121|nr:HAMP domain-containing sensor histidine kinase [Gracilibacillus timonensis]